MSNHVEADAIEALTGLTPKDQIQTQVRYEKRRERAARIAQHYESLLEQDESLVVVLWGDVMKLKDRLPSAIKDILNAKMARTTDEADQIDVRRLVVRSTYYHWYGIQKADFRFLPILSVTGEEQSDSKFVFPLAVVSNKRTREAELVR